MERALLVINPRSGKGRAPSVVEIAKRIAPMHGYQLEVKLIEGPGHGKELALEAVQNGIPLVISAGGDGTLNSIASGLLGSDTALGIVAMGSGNGYARSLSLPLDAEAALHRAFTGEKKKMDICYLNDMPFLGTAGIGFDARVAHRFDKSKGRGMLGYAKIIVQEILGTPPMRVTGEVSGDPSTGVGKTKLDEDVLMVVFCNTREFGNGAVISPGSKPDDGLAEIRVVRKPSFFPLIQTFIQIYTHKADKSKYIRNVVSTEADLHQTGTLAHLDGEPAEVGNTVRFRLEKARLWVVV